MATGIIDLSTLTDDDIPSGVDLVAAFLYWETVETPNSGSGSANATFQGKLPAATFDPLKRQDISLIAKVLNPSGTAPCWSSGGATGPADGAHQMFAYRADVLRFIPIDPATGKRVVKTQYEVRLPDAGHGNTVPSTAGASLVVVYKDPTKPLTSIVIYNGGHTMDASTQMMNRTLKGFYQAGTSTGTSTIKAKMTHIVGDGSAGFSELLWFASGETATNLLATTPFQGLASQPSSDPAWDNKTFDVSSLVGQDASSVTTRVDHDSFTPYACLSWGAIIFSTTVQDTDDDGLLDVWELPQDPLNPLKDPNGRTLPNLNAMGANPLVKDVFVEIGALKTTTANSNPIQGTVPLHNHTPTQAALDMVGDAFKNAPVINPTNACGPPPAAYTCGPTGIKIHFDVGNQYQTKPGSSPPVADPYVIQTPFAQGSLGEEILETACVPTATNTCLFPSYPGTIGWKTGYRVLRDQPLNYGDEAACANAELQWTEWYLSGALTPPPTDCQRRFDHVRKDLFHYALFVHALGLPRVYENGDCVKFPLSIDPLGSCIPRNVSGTADGGGSGGGDLEVALGLWDSFSGTPAEVAARTTFMQASTLMHELGHNFRLRHGGGPPIPDPTTGILKAQPNCKPNVQSVMSYLFQMNGLMCDQASAALTPQCVGKTPGETVIDFSRQVLGGVGLNENSLTEQPPSGLAGMIYRTRWFSPTSFLDQTSTFAPPASRHCDGTILSTGEAPLFRIDGTSLGSVDWNGNLTIDAGTNTAGQDVNFNGGPNSSLATVTDGAFSGFNDWANIDLRHVGSRRNVASHGGPLSVDQGQGDNGQGDNGQGDNGQGDNGQGDNGQGDNGQGDNGQGDNGAPIGDVDLDVARALGNTPTLLKPNIVGKTIVVNWTAPHVDVNFLTHYYVYRVIGTAVTPATLGTKVLVSANPVGPTTTSLVDNTVKNNTNYTYWVQAQFSINNKGQACGTGESCLSGVSNYQTIFMK